MNSKEYLKQIATTEVIDCTNNDKAKKRIANIFPVGISTIEEDLEVLYWLIENLYVAPELLELRLTDPHNNVFSDKGIKYHNGIEIKNKDFRKYIDRIHKLKYGG